MSIKLKLSFFDFRHIRTDISRLQFNLIFLKIMNSFCLIAIAYELALLLNFDVTKYFLVVGVIFSFLLLCFCIQRIRGMSFKLLALCPPLLFIAPDKYGYDYDKDTFYIICIIVKRAVQLMVEVAVLIVFLFYLRTSIPSLSYVPTPVKVIAYSLPSTEENETAATSFNVGNATLILDKSLSVTKLSENNVLVLKYNSKYVELVVYDDDNTYSSWQYSGGFYRINGVSVQFYNATEAEINSILEDINVRN